MAGRFTSVALPAAAGAFLLLALTGCMDRDLLKVSR
jgi:hypothetical protein